MRMILTILMLLPLVSNSQDSTCRPLYVWNTEIENTQLEEKLSDRIADQIETSLTDYSQCIVLNRRNYNLHERHKNNEKIVRSINDLNPNAVNGLKTVQAEWIVLSNLLLETNGEDSIYALSISIEDIGTTQIVKKSEAYLSVNEIKKPGQRFFVINRLIARMLGGKGKSVKDSPKSDASRMKLAVETTRNTSARYVGSFNKPAWDEAEAIYQKALRSVENKEYESAIVQMNDAMDKYLEIYLNAGLSTNEPLSKKYTFSLSHDHEIELQLEKGQKIQIKVSGTIFLGPNIKHATAEGVTDFRNLFLKQYNIEENIPHGAVMIKSPGDLQWNYLGTSMTFQALQTDTLPVQFMVNDNQQEDNKGSFKVEIIIE